MCRQKQAGRSLLFILRRREGEKGWKGVNHAKALLSIPGGRPPGPVPDNAPARLSGTIVLTSPWTPIGKGLLPLREALEIPRPFPREWVGEFQNSEDIPRFLIEGGKVGWQKWSRAARCDNFFHRAERRGRKQLK